MSERPLLRIRARPSVLPVAAWVVARLAVVGAPVAGGDVPVAAARTAFVDVTVLPMDDDRALPHQTVVVEGGRIIAVRAADSVDLGEDTRRIDGRGRFLLPGFTDAHVHLYSAVELPLYLANGVTTVFNLNGRPAHLEWRRRVAAGELPGPRILTTGPLFASAESAEAAVRRVDEQAAAGYDGVKIYWQVGAEEYPALVAAAKRHGLLVTGHVARRPGFEATMRAGQSIAHAEEYLYSYFDPTGEGEPAKVVLDHGRIPEAVRLTAEAGVTVTPTLSMYRDILGQATGLERYLEKPELRLLSPWLRAGLEPGVNRYHGRFSPEVVDHMRRSFEFQRELVRALAATGVPLFVGTDSTGIGPVAGFSIHEEVAELVAAGLSPFRAIAAATSAPARFLGRGEEDGTIAPGRRADLVLLALDPRIEVGGTRAIEGVMAAGRWYDASALSALVEAVPAGYARELSGAMERLARDPVSADAYLAAHDPLNVMAGAALEEYVARHGVTALRSLARSIRAAVPDSRVVGEEAVNGLGYLLLGAGRSAEAIEVFEVNTEGFPASANAFDSLAEAWAKSGDGERATALYRHALEIDRDYPNAPAAREFLAAHGTAPAGP